MGRLLISAAHTLENPGAIYQDLREADLTRKFLNLTIPHLEKSGITFQAVPLDLPLLQRIDWINSTGYTEEQGDIFVEVHINDGGKRGVESWYKGSAGPSNKSQKLAEHLAQHITSKKGYTNQGAKSEYEHELTSLLILNSTNPSGTAIELLYIDNPEDIAILKDEKQLDELAKTLVDAIKEFIDNPPKVEPAPEQTKQEDDNDDDLLGPQSPIPSLPSFPSFGPGGGLPSRSPFAPPSPGNSPFGAFGGASPQTQPGGNSKSLLMDRDQRKEMIKKTYQKVLGKDPKQSDENYYLNIGVSEDELIKKLIDTEDFKKMVEDSKRIKELEDESEKLKAKATALESNLSDTRSMQESLNKLLEQKNIMISRLYHELVAHNIIQQGEHYDSRKAKENADQQNTPTLTQTKTLNRKVFEKLMRIAKL